MQTELSIRHEGRDYEVLVSGEGEFVVNLGVQDGSSVILKADSFAALQKKVKKIKTPFELEFTELVPSGPRNGTVTGIHAANGNLLVRWVNGTTEQVPGYHASQYMPRLSEEDYETLRYLTEERNRVARELENFVKPRAFRSLKQAATEAQARAAKEAGNEG
jgi:hypothetical protein